MSLNFYKSVENLKDFLENKGTQEINDFVKAYIDAFSKIRKLE